MKIEDIKKSDIGKTYNVVANDCCVNINFTSELLRILDEGDTLAFDNGVLIGTPWGVTELEEIKNK